MTSLHPPSTRLQSLDSIRVAVVIPCFRQAHFLGEAIESVLAQTHDFVELLVVDDGSPDHTADVARQYKGARYLRQDNQGLSAARNTGLQTTDAEFVLFLDADDRLLPNALVANLACFQSRPEAALAYGAYRHMDEHGNPLDLPRRGGADAPEDDGDSYAALLRRNIVEMHGAVMYRTEALASVGGFDPALDASEDYDVYLRIAAVAPIVAHDELVAEYRKYEGSMSFDARRMLAATLKVLRRHGRKIDLSPARRQAYRQGIEMWKGYYGPLLVSQLRNKIRSGAPIVSILRDGATSLAQTPDILLKRVAAKIEKKTTRRVRRRARAIFARQNPRGMILMYHRIAQTMSDAWGLCVGRENFVRQIEYLKRTCDVLPLGDLASTRTFARPSVAITFDDGYLDNLRHALPILESHGVPATVFVTGGPGNVADEFWWDTLERILLQPNRLPPRPEFSVAGVPYRFDVGEWADYSAGDARGFHEWRVESYTRPTSRHTMFNVLYTHLATLPEHRRGAELRAIASALSVDLDPAPAPRRMSAREITELDRSRFIEIGGHTTSHPALSSLPPEEQAAEIMVNRDHLQGLIGKPIRSFAYPHGDYAPETLNALKSLGFEFACTTQGKILADDHGPLELPRHQVEDWDREEFEYHLNAWWASE